MRNWNLNNIKNKFRAKKIQNRARNLELMNGHDVKIDETTAGNKIEVLVLHDISSAAKDDREKNKYLTPATANYASFDIYI